MEFNILRFEAPIAHNPATDRVIMGASAVAPEFGRGAAAAVTILAEVCPYETFAAKCVEETTRRAKQEGFAWPSNAASLERETPEPRLPVTAFPSNNALCHFLENELISSRTRDRIRFKLRMLPAPGRFQRSPDSLQLPRRPCRGANACRPRRRRLRSAGNYYTSPADPRSAGSLVCKTSRNRSDSHQTLASGGCPRESASRLAKRKSLSPLVIVASDNVEPFWTLRPEDIEIDESRSVRQSVSGKVQFEGIVF
jgi:hypothetical protein